MAPIKDKGNSQALTYGYQGIPRVNNNDLKCIVFIITIIISNIMSMNIVMNMIIIIMTVIVLFVVGGMTLSVNVSGRDSTSVRVRTGVRIMVIIKL